MNKIQFFALSLWITGVSVLPVWAVEGPIQATVYESGSNKTKVLFHMKREESSANGKTVLTEVFTDLEGKEALRSETLFEGEQFKSYTLQQDQVHESAKIEARDGKLFFEYTDSKGKVKKDDEKWRDNFVLGTLMSRFLTPRWQELVDGKTIEMRWGVPERRETVGFKIFKTEEIKMDGQDVLVAKMKPSSMIISALVDPLYFYFNKSTKRLIEYRGRTLPKIQVKGEWKDLDAETVYSQ